MTYNAVVFASGNGSNFENLVKKEQESNVKISLLIVDQRDAGVIKRAEKLKVPYRIIERGNLTKQAHEAQIMMTIDALDFDYILLAGYMKIFSESFVTKYERKIINIHPSLLPSFKGANGVLDAYDYGVKITGATVHFVDVHVDSGEIIDQMSLEIKEDDTLEMVKRNVHDLEHILYPRALKKLTKGG